MIGLEGSERKPPVAQPEQIRAHLLLAQLLWRAPVMNGQTPYSVEVDALGSRRQPGRPHVFSHPPAQCCHRGLLCFEVRPAAQPRPTSMLASCFTSHDTFLYGEAVQSNGCLQRWPGHQVDCRRQDRAAARSRRTSLYRDPGHFRLRSVGLFSAIQGSVHCLRRLGDSLSRDRGCATPA